MWRAFRIAAMLFGAAVMLSGEALADSFWDRLQPEQTVGSFRAVSLYEGARGEAMGGRFVSGKYGFVVDLLEIESVPQAFFWIKTPPTSDKGEPHTCEHLLLGKGNRGRHVASLEDMSLGSSSAYTGQLRTCYHFNTIADEQAFRRLFEAKLVALLQPDFTDEEIKREVCHVGVEEDPETGELSLEEKGTVYTEMVSSFEKPWYYHASALWDLVYGDGHPISNIAGGSPDGLRTLTPEDLRRFHQRTHRLANMGVIIAVPSTVDTGSLLQWLDALLDELGETPTAGREVGIAVRGLPEPGAGPHGAIRAVSHPSEDPEDPASIHLCWPAWLDLDSTEEFLLRLFVGALSSGDASRLYKLLVDSSTREADFGIREVWGWVPRYPGTPVWIGFGGLDAARVDTRAAEGIRASVLREIERICAYDDGSEELAAFNREVEGHLLRSDRERRERLDSPPMFGFRSGPAGWWVSHLETLERVEGFRKSLILREQYEEASRLLRSYTNAWKDLVRRWRLLEAEPYAVGSVPDPELLDQLRHDKEARLRSYTAGFRARYGAEDDAQAIALYQTEFNSTTAHLDSLASGQDIPAFVSNPPLTLDDQLQYEVLSLPGRMPLVASAFPHMTSSTFGVAFRLDVVPESLLVYVPFLPEVLTSLGAIKDGVVIRYDEMQRRLREDLLRYGARFDHGYETGRTELLLEGSGSSPAELRRVIEWMEASLYAPYLHADNLSRILDVIDQRLVALQTTTKHAEESWADGPVYAYRHQDDPLFLSTRCYMTAAHHMQRLRFLLTDAGPAHGAVTTMLDRFTSYGRGRSRRELTELLSLLAEAGTRASADDAERAPSLPFPIDGVPAGLLDIVVRALRTTLPDIPDAALEQDWEYLCQRIKRDIAVEPEHAMAAIRHTLELLLKSDNTRAYLVSNGDDRSAVMSGVARLARLLDSDHPSVRQHYSADKRIIARLAERIPVAREPLYVGLVHEGTNNGLLAYSARYAAPLDTSSVTEYLAGKLFGGGGPHSLFMRTWGAGLAYSNGISVDEMRGRVSYYAERCPDVAQTMAFVVNELKTAEHRPGLADYAVAQAFRRTRAASRYESRGRAMAADLADGYTPERVAAFRSRILEIGGVDGLHDSLVERLPGIYGKVLVGYGPPLSESVEGCFFLIGPEPQFQSLEAHIASTEGPEPIYRLYPRDFWLVP